MRKFHFAPVLCFALLILVIPAFAFVGQGSPSAPSGEDPVILGFPSAGSDPSGNIEPLSAEDYASGNFYLVQDHETGDVMALTPADYIKGVVAAEMPVSYHAEALKAQAVAAHSYALRQIGEQLASPDPALKGAYLSTDPDHFQGWMSKAEMQALWGSSFEVNYRKLSDAVDEVIGKALTFEEEPIAAAFHAISGGRTESASVVWGREVSYLTPVESEGDELSPDYETVTLLKREEVSHALTSLWAELVLPEDPEQWFTIRQRSESGTVTEVTVGNLTLSGADIREALKLRSANFTVSWGAEGFAFTTLGYGHGVGMSQYGADYLARQGKTWEEILRHYYTGVSITAIA